MWTSLEFYRQVLHHTPSWVWLVFASLLALGARQLRDRQVKPWTVLIAPVVFMLIGVIGTGRSGLALATWACVASVASVACVTALRWLPLLKGTAFNAQAKRLHLPGSVSSGAWMIAKFFVSYFINVFLAVYPVLAKTSQAIVFTSTAMGLLTGKRLKEIRVVPSALAVLRERLKLQPADQRSPEHFYGLTLMQANRRL